MTNPKQLEYFHDETLKRRQWTRLIALVVLATAACAMLSDIAMLWRLVESDFRFYLKMSPRWAWYSLINALMNSIMHGLMISGALSILNRRCGAWRRLVGCVVVFIAGSIASFVLTLFPDAGYNRVWQFYEAAASIAGLALDVVVLMLIIQPPVRGLLEPQAPERHGLDSTTSGSRSA